MSSFYSLLIGGFLSSVGGILAILLNSRSEQKKEIEYIKISLEDEISEFQTTIRNMLETTKTSQYIPKKYLDELSANMEFFYNHRTKLFLINNKETRRQIRMFYKHLKEAIELTLISDSMDNTNKAVDKSVNTFNKILTDATSLEATLNQINFKILYFI